MVHTGTIPCYRTNVMRPHFSKPVLLGALLYCAFFALPFCRPPLSSFSARWSAAKALEEADTLLLMRMKGMTIQKAFIRTKYPQ
jgi:hypothetical protein